MTVNTPRRRGADRVGAFDRVANISIKEAPSAKTVASNIRVVVRVRPENKTELDGNYSNVVRVLDERLLVFDPKEEEAPDFYHGRRRKMRDLTKKKQRDMRFAFDYVFDMDCVNMDVYENTTKCVLDGLLDGFNCSVFAYGATGAGKTFTMKGTLDQPGVMFLTMMDLYQRIEQMKEEKTCDVAVSYLEVYNEQIRDLLNPGEYLPIREDPNSGSVVTGLSLHKPKDAEGLLHMLEFGNRNRTQHPTDANAESSRSHGVFQVFVRQKERTANVSADVSVAKMSLIDLAGSERATVTKNCGVRFREGANINKSLLALGNCINALAEGKSKGYVPYRNSKLTRLLKDSLGGNCRTVMIAAVSPSALSYEDTYNTLKYADRAKHIKANLKKNVVSVDYHISHYAKLIEELRAEVDTYKDRLRGFETGSLSMMVGRPSSSMDTEVDRLQEVMFSVFQDRMNIRKEIMEMEGSDRDITYKIYQKERSLSRIDLLHSDTSTTEKVRSKIQRAIHTSKKRQANVARLKADANVKMSQNVSDLQRVENQMETLASDGATPEILELSLRTRHLEVELRDTKRQVKFLKKLCRAQQRETQATEKLVRSLLCGFKRQHYLLRSQGCCTPDLTADFESVRQQVLGEREVSWADQSGVSMEVSSTTNTGGDAGGGERSPGSDVFTGGGRKDSTDDGFDINQLLDFPVLVSVDTTPKTPHQSGRCRPQMPGSAQSVAMTPCTPGSHRKGRFTPRRRSSMPVFDMATPITTKMSGSHQLLTPSNKQQQTAATSSALGSPVLAIDDDFEILSSGPSSTFKTKSRLNLPPPPPSNSTSTSHSTNNASSAASTQGHSTTLTLSLAPKPAGQVIHRPPPVLTSSQAGPPIDSSGQYGSYTGQALNDRRHLFSVAGGTVGQAKAEGSCANCVGGQNGHNMNRYQASRNGQCVHTQQPSGKNGGSLQHDLNETFTKIEGIEPLRDSPGMNSRQGRIKQVTTSMEVAPSSHIPVVQSSSTTAVNPPVSKSHSGPFIKPNAVSQSTALNETYTQPDVRNSKIGQPVQRNGCHSNTGSRPYCVNSAPFIKPVGQLQMSGSLSQPTSTQTSQVPNPTQQTVTVSSVPHPPAGQSLVHSSCPPGVVTHPTPPPVKMAIGSAGALTSQAKTMTTTLHGGGATVTKSKPQAKDGSTRTDGEAPGCQPRLLNVTVTKQQPSVIQGKENVSPPYTEEGGAERGGASTRGRPAAVRAMDFSSMPSPAGQLTFAEALKSPTVRSLREAGVAPFSPRSPLSARDNLPHRLFRDLSAKKPAVSYKDEVARDLERMGLPSARERAQSATRVPTVRPSYMKMTTSACNRKRGLDNEEASGPGRPSRVAREPVKKPTRLVRSKSFNVQCSAPKWNSRF